MASSSDTTILIRPDEGEDDSDASQPPKYSEIDLGTADGESNAGVPDVVVPDELPPPYSANLFVNCRVCQVPIDLERRQHLAVVKCSQCNEATPLKPAAPGKKYVRCPCNCLLICNANARRTACPRANCRRMISLQATDTYGRPAVLATAPRAAVRANCAHCNQVFVVLKATVNTRLARCPHCDKVSAVGYGYIKRKVSLFGIIGAVFLILGIATTVVSAFTTSGYGVYIIWVGAYIVGGLNLLRAMLFCCHKVSRPIE